MREGSDAHPASRWPSGEWRVWWLGLILGTPGLPAALWLLVRLSGVPQSPRASWIIYAVMPTLYLLGMALLASLLVRAARIRREQGNRG